MRTLLISLTLAAAAVGSTAVAAERISDAQYVEAARCIGLSEGAGVDASAIKALLKSQTRGRMDFIVDRADSARRDAARSVKKATGEDLGRLTTERDSACAQFNQAS
jgi:hypothetical protein